MKIWLIASLALGVALCCEAFLPSAPKTRSRQQPLFQYDGKPAMWSGRANGDTVNGWQGGPGTSERYRNGENGRRRINDPWPGSGTERWRGGQDGRPRMNTADVNWGTNSRSWQGGQGIADARWQSQDVGRRSATAERWEQGSWEGGRNAAVTETSRAVSDSMIEPAPPQISLEDQIKKLLLEDLFYEDRKVVQDALAQLAEMSYEDSQADRCSKIIFDIGGASILVGVMRKWISDASLQGMACVLFANVAARSNEFRRVLTDVGGVEAVVNALSRHPTNEDVQCDGLIALTSLDLDQTGASRLVKDFYGHELIIDAMKQFPLNDQVQDFGCEMLWKMTQSEGLKNAIVQAGGVSVLVNTLEHYTDVDEAAERADRKWLQKCRIALIRLLWKDEFGTINIRGE